MADRGETFISPTMKSRMTFLVTTADSVGERILVEFLNEPDDVGPPLHYHPEQQEVFEVLEGELTFELASETRTVRSGESVVVPPGTPHRFYNASNRPVRFTSEHRPALGWERFITTMYDLDYDGHCNEKALPRPLQLFCTLGHRNGEEFIAGPPRFAQRVLSVVGKFLGRVFRISPFYRSERRASRFASDSKQ